MRPFRHRQWSLKKELPGIDAELRISILMRRGIGKPDQRTKNFKARANTHQKPTAL
jgi:hypothetical protein